VLPLWQLDHYDDLKERARGRIEGESHISFYTVVGIIRASALVALRAFTTVSASTVISCVALKINSEKSAWSSQSRRISRDVRLDLFGQSYTVASDIAHGHIPDEEKGSGSWYSVLVFGSLVLTSKAFA
jgi:hypothetical protein